MRTGAIRWQGCTCRCEATGSWRQGLVALAERLCGGRIGVVLEGGYDLQVLALGVADTCRALLGDDQPAAGYDRGV